MKFLLICSAGMSTSLLVTKMKKAAEERGLDLEILAHSISDAKRFYDEVDMVLLGPQVRFLKDEVSKAVNVPVQVIDMRSYGRMDGAKVLEDALKELQA
ncbi:MAG TPA: PTS sugar transporter subunit IIB [Bacillota bacterium]|nr:PTS sugar transporter subunit IIB [Bacillota bacterium]HPZ90732.1 PTS sugar transporter subunit IIB [Bacillota bacterium]HQE02591.1 PTS sugar transporter subunit IIB [Bacillota bacterium]